MTPGQEGLLRKAHESIRAARLLLDNQLYDIAISRAYYVMFYVASALLLGKGLSFSRHSAVVAAFGQHFAKTGLAPAEFHRYLLDANDDRNASDYSISSGFTEARAAKQIERAEKFLSLAETIIGALP